MKRFQNRSGWLHAPQPGCQLCIAHHVRQAVIPPLEEIGELLMIQAHQRQDAGMQVVNVDRIVKRRGDQAKSLLALYPFAKFVYIFILLDNSPEKGTEYRNGCWN